MSFYCGSTAGGCGIKTNRSDPCPHGVNTLLKEEKDANSYNVRLYIVNLLNENCVRDILSNKRYPI